MFIVFTAHPVNYKQSKPSTSVGFSSPASDDSNEFTTEYSQENFDDDDDISASAVATLVG